MRVIERSEFRDQKGVISSVNRLLGMLRHGTSWYAEMSAQDLVTQYLERTLGNEITLLRNINLPTIDVPLPMILIGFDRIYLLLATSVRVRPGSRSVRDIFSQFLSEPRPQIRLITAVQALHDYLVEQGVDPPPIEAVLAFTDPHSYPDLTQPDIHVVFADTLEPFIANLAHFSQPAQVQFADQLLDLLVHPRQPPSPPKENLDPKQLEDVVADEHPDVIPTNALSPAHPLRANTVAFGRFRFSRRGLTRLGLILALEVVIVVVLGLLALAVNLLG